MVGLLAGVAIAGRPSAVGNLALPQATAVGTTTVPGTSAPFPSSSSSTSTTAETTTTTAAPTTTTTTPANPATTRVLAVNGTKRSGIARRTADRLIAAGWLNTTPTDSIDIVELSAVYYREGFRAAAEGVATALGLDPSTVVPLGQPISAVDDQADVVMAIGNDFTE